MSFTVETAYSVNTLYVPTLWRCAVEHHEVRNCNTGRPSMYDDSFDENVSSRAGHAETCAVLLKKGTSDTYVEPSGHNMLSQSLLGLVKRDTRRLRRCLVVHLEELFEGAHEVALELLLQIAGKPGTA